jgi:hypothetical protein
MVFDCMASRRARKRPIVDRPGCHVECFLCGAARNTLARKEKEGGAQLHHQTGQEVIWQAWWHCDCNSFHIEYAASTLTQTHCTNSADFIMHVHTICFSHRYDSYICKQATVLTRVPSDSFKTQLTVYCPINFYTQCPLPASLYALPQPLSILRWPSHPSQYDSQEDSTLFNRNNSPRVD